MSGTFDLFAYGSLRTGQPANMMLEHCTLLGDAVVDGLLYDIDSRFTAVILYGDAPVYGELWRCPAPLLLALDQYEGVSTGLFRRVAVTARKTDGSPAPCWVYAAGPALSRKLVPEHRIESGRTARTPPGDTDAD